MSRPAERARASGVPSESYQELEELEDEAILAQETSAHLPQKRARVTEEARSIVISEPTASSQPIEAGELTFRVGRGDPTLVIDRRELEATRRKILERRGRRAKGHGRKLVWAVLAAAAFAGGGLVVFLSMRASGPPHVLDLSQAAPARNPERSRTPVTAASSGLSAQQQEAERSPPKVSLEELPLERPRRRQ